LSLTSEFGFIYFVNRSDILIDILNKYVLSTSSFTLFVDVLFNYFASYFLNNFLHPRYKNDVSFLTKDNSKSCSGVQNNLSAPPVLLYKNNTIFRVVSPPQSNDSFYRWMLVPFAVAKEPKIQLQK
jgi:hypothetical protein